MGGTMMRTMALTTLASAIAAAQAPAAAPVEYTLTYVAGASSVQVRLHLPESIATPASFVFPRGYPGGYSVVHYERYVSGLTARSASGALDVKAEDFGPRWTIGAPGERITEVAYGVEVERMEREILSGVDTSKIRPGYVGLLGYSVFGYLDGLERRPVTLDVAAPPAWPVLSSLAPAVPPPVGHVTGRAPHYDELADSQVLMGPRLQLRNADGDVALVMGIYAETAEDVDLETALARQALDRVSAYYGDRALAHYTVHLELLRPLDGHDYGFSQEHVDSGTFSLDTSRAMTAASTVTERDTTLFNYAHHMAHSWVPKRAYGVGYSPFTWELPPVIDTIWFNEGFGRYSAIAAIADGMSAAEGSAYRRVKLDALRDIVNAAPPFMQRMSMEVLSREASFMYSDDFRTGRNIFSRGALMAAEMDDAIQTSTKGAKRLRDALRAIVARTVSTGRPFTTAEFPGLVRAATGVDVRRIFEKWMAARQ
jgi:predicted metalloprotease with PDZ domain